MFEPQLTSQTELFTEERLRKRLREVRLCAEELPEGCEAWGAVPRRHLCWNNTGEDEQARIGLPSCVLLASKAPEAPQSTKAIATAVGGVPELAGNILSLKTQRRTLCLEDMDNLSWD